MATNAKTELWQENERLRAENEELKLEIIQKNKDTNVCHDGHSKGRKIPWYKSKKVLSLALLGVTCVILVAALVIIYRASDNNSALLTSSALAAGLDGGILNSQPYEIAVDTNSDPLLQGCQTSDAKRSFPDLDYALLGYNILKGYPLQVGHDPGFTLPVFQADYREAGHTADCRYNVPKGMIIIPDVACVTSFSSTIVQSRYEFAESLSTSASARGGGWGVSFSASLGYKQSSASISTGESLLIMSKASCDYYYSKLLQKSAPPFHPLFIEWVHRLNEASAEDKTLYIEFFEQYGTHFLSEVTFGANFVYEHEMKTKTYERMTERGVNVATSASYYGLFSIGGGGDFRLDASAKAAVSEFQNSVTSKTVTRGAPPPADGDALTWASSVKETPVPVKYQLLSIEELFTKDFMSSLNVDYKVINENIQHHKMNYCTHLKESGQVDSCRGLLPGIVLENTRLTGYYSEISADLATCQDRCAEDKNCTSISKCVQCTGFYAGRCYFFSENNEKTAMEQSGWETTIFRPKIPGTMKLLRTSIQGIDRNERQNNTENSEMCKEWCLEDEQCVAYSFCSTGCTKTQNCALFGQDGITGFTVEETTESYVLGLRSRLS